MINLIPKHAQKSIHFEYLIRVASVWLILWSISLLAAASILLPPYVLIGTQVAGYEQSATEAMERVHEYKNTSTELILASQEAKQIIDESLIAAFTGYLHMVESLQGEQVQVTEIDLSRTEEGMVPMLISGIASDRQALASFRDRLLADDRVSAVDLPISNLTSDRDINFDITVTLVKQTNV
jgi:hypothetical protein